MGITRRKNDPFKVSPGNVWIYAQNKPSLIADDFKEKFDIPVIDTLKILMARGVFKWFAVRRKLIKQKDIWKREISELLTDLADAKQQKDHYKVQFIRGKLSVLIRCREEIRELCHSERWSSPDFDQDALKILEEELNIHG